MKCLNSTIDQQLEEVRWLFWIISFVKPLQSWFFGGSIFLILQEIET